MANVVVDDDRAPAAGIPAAADSLSVGDLQPTPAEMWEMLLRFSGPTPDELAAMRTTVDVLFQRGHDFVVRTYDHLRRIPETAAVLGWETEVDEAHLAERRRFFTLWLARTLSLDLGADFADYLFRAGHIHAGHGPRRIHTPPMWVTGSMGLVLASFAESIRSAHGDAGLVAQSLAGWNKYLMLQLNQMNFGYAVARALDAGRHRLRVGVYGIARVAWQRDSVEVGHEAGGTVVEALRKLLNYAPFLRTMMFEQSWVGKQRDDESWVTPAPVYTLRSSWRVLLGGEDLRFKGGFERVIEPGGELSIFPPGR